MLKILLMDDLWNGYRYFYLRGYLCDSEYLSESFECSCCSVPSRHREMGLLGNLEWFEDGFLSIMKELCWEVSHEGGFSVGVSYHRLDFLRNKIVNHSKGATCSCVISIDRASLTVGSLNLNSIRSKKLRKNTSILFSNCFMFWMNKIEMDCSLRW